MIRGGMILLALAIALSLSAKLTIAADDKEEGFTTIFDGKSLDGWKVGGDPDTFKLKNGEVVANGKVSHLYYVGDPKPFKNFELRVDVMTEPNSNGGIYFHTKYQDKGFPKYGFEAQVNQSHSDWKRTGSLYDVVNVKETYVKDGEWYTETIIVKDKNVKIKINDKTVVDYTEPADQKAGEQYTRKLDEGTFALQGHDPKSFVHYKNIRVKRLD
jgi:hypothetical protein